MFKEIIIPCLTITTMMLLISAGCSKKTPTDSTTTGSITGVVTDSTTSTALAGATVVTGPATSSVTTNTSGQFTINGVNAGTYTVTVSKTGYCSNIGSATVTTGNTATINIALTSASAIIEWISIPAGNFKMGSLGIDPGAYSYEQPQHTVYLDAYQISKYEITNAHYKAFIDAGGYSDSAYWTTEGWSWRTANSITEPCYWSSGQYNSGPSFPNHPVVGVSWYEAYAFCNWAGGHLPTEAQWEKAARGTDSSNYWPWGSAWNAANCNSYFNASPDTFAYSSPVGYFSLGQSPYGLYDMAGNVWKWCNDWFQSDYYSVSPTSNPQGATSGTYRVIRGGSFSTNDAYCRTAIRYYDPPVYRYFYFGFRPAK